MPEEPNPPQKNPSGSHRGESDSGHKKSRALATKETGLAKPPPAKTPATQNGNGSRPPTNPGVTPLSPLPVAPRVQRPENSPRLRSLLWSALAFVGIPTLLSIVYFGVLASDQYAARASFIIKMQTGAQGNRGALFGIVGTNPLSIEDMLVVKQYVSEKQILRDIEPEMDIRRMFSTKRADWWARLKQWPDFRRILTGEVWSKGLFAPVSEEDLLRYWNKMVTVNFDSTTGLSSLEVKAFSAGDAKLLAEKVLGLGEELVNRISERLKSDSLAFARNEVEDAHSRAMKSLDDLQSFQKEAQQIDPEGFAKTKGELQARLEADISQCLSQIEILRKSLPEDAPGIQQIKMRVGALQEQLLIHRVKSTEVGTKDSASVVLTEFGKRRMDSDFATQAYMSALSSLETARRDAAQQSRYLEAFSRPQLPQTPEYPKRLQGVLLVFFGSALIWGIGRLFIDVAKEHL